MLASRAWSPAPYQVPPGARWLRSTSVPNVGERTCPEGAPDPRKLIVPEDRPRVVA